MGLNDFSTSSDSENNNIEDNDKESQTKANQSSGESSNANQCPECETEGEETEHWYYRCTTPSDECSVITFIKPRENTQ